MGELLRETILRNQTKRIVWQNISLEDRKKYVLASSTISFLNVVLEYNTPEVITLRFYLVNRYQGTFCKILYLYNFRDKKGKWIGNPHPIPYRSLAKLMPNDKTIVCEVDYYTYYYDMLSRLPDSAKKRSNYRDEIKNRMHKILTIFNMITLVSFIPKSIEIVKDESLSLAIDIFHTEWLRACADSFDSFNTKDMTKYELIEILVNIATHS